MNNAVSVPSPVNAVGAQTLRRGLMVLRLLTRAGPGGLRMGEICRQVALSKPTTVRLTRTLVDEGFVLQDMRSGRYRLGPEAYAVGLAAEPSYELQRLAAPTLRALATESEDTVFFTVMHGYESICLSRHEGEFPIRNQLLKPGDRVPIGVGAGGCALLAALDDAEVRRVLALTLLVRQQKYPRCTDEAIWQMVRNTRERGFCVMPGLLLADAWAVGAVVRDGNGQPVASISVAAIKSRLGATRATLIGLRLVQASLDLGSLAYNATVDIQGTAAITTSPANSAAR